MCIRDRTNPLMSGRSWTRSWTALPLWLMPIINLIWNVKSYSSLTSTLLIHGYAKRGERNGQFNFLSPYFFSLFFSLLPIFFGRFSLLPDFSPFSLISLLRGLFYLLLHHSASFPHVLKEGKHTKHGNLSCRCISLFPYYLSVSSCKLEALMFTTFILTTV